MISRGRFNDVIAQVRFSSEFLWPQAWCGDALTKVHSFLIAIFGESIHLQVSEVHLCADVVGYDFSQCNYETQFVTQVARALGLSRGKVYQLIRQEHLPVIPFGRTKRVLPASLQDWLKRREKSLSA